MIITFIVAQPLVFALLIALGGAMFGYRYSAAVAVVGSIFNFFAVLKVMITFFKSESAMQSYSLRWIQVGDFSIDWDFRVDSFTLVMFFVVTGVSLGVLTYGVGYMAGDPHLPRFLSYILLFTHFMLLLVSANNFVVLFLGWEGVGLCSYLLIAFWYTRVDATRAALKAMLVNRVGDGAFIVAMALAYYLFGSLKFDVIFLQLPHVENFTIYFCSQFEPSVVGLICFFLLLAAMSKSAQIGLHTWLPDAMEGPTPVSALIHAATMVTAGVFLIIRCYPLFELSPDVKIGMVIVGVLTALLGAGVALVQHDIKKIVAYSTCSQLGYMVAACGLSGYSFAFLHLTTHAFFKAALFMAAGILIHMYRGQQDIRAMGGLQHYFATSPLSCGALICVLAAQLVAVLPLVGFPSTSGYYSKHHIFTLALENQTGIAYFAYGGLVFAALLTVFYNVRLLVYLFTGPKIRVITPHFNTFESLMVLPLTLLSLIGVAAPSFFSELLRAGNIITLNGSGSTISAFANHAPTFLALIAAGVSFFLFRFRSRRITEIMARSPIARVVYVFFVQKWYFDTVYNKFLVKPILWFSTRLLYLFDQGLFQRLGPKGLQTTISSGSSYLGRWQSGSINDYAWSFLIFQVFILAYYLIFIFTGEVSHPSVDDCGFSTEYDMLPYRMVRLMGK